TKIPGEPAGNGKYRKHLQEIRQRCWVLKRVSSVGVNVAAAIGPQHLDRYLRSHRPLHDTLRIYRGIDKDRLAVASNHRLTAFIQLRHLRGEGFHQRGRSIRFEILDYTLRNENDRIK